MLIADDYQELEVWYPILRLREAGWQVTTVGVESKRSYLGKHGYPIEVDASVESLAAKSFDVVIVPGGWAPDKIRRSGAALDLVRQLFSAEKTVAAICHGGWVLASAGVAKGRRCTSAAAIRDDLVNAGAKWEDEEVVIDGRLITSRKPDDLPAFCRAILESVR